MGGRCRGNPSSLVAISGVIAGAGYEGTLEDFSAKEIIKTGGGGSELLSFLLKVSRKAKKVKQRASELKFLLRLIFKGFLLG